MATLFNQLIIVTQDQSGRQSSNFLATQDQSGFTEPLLEDVWSAYQNLTSAKVIAVQFQKTNLLAGTLTPGPYDTAFDRATLMTRALDSLRGHIDIVAPLSSIFTGDGLTVDMSNTAVMTFVAAVKAAIGTGSGSPITDVPYGKRTRVHPNIGG